MGNHREEMDKGNENSQETTRGFGQSSENTN